MAERHLLYLGSTSLQIARVHRGQISLASHLTPADGPPALATWLRGNPKVRCILLTDLPDDLDEIIALLPPGTYTRQRLCDQLNSAIGGHAWGQVYGTVE